MEKDATSARGALDTAVGQALLGMLGERVEDGPYTLDLLGQMVVDAVVKSADDLGYVLQDPR